MSSPSIVVLTEEALGPDDARRITALHADESPRYRVLVPADTRRNMLADVLDRLSLLELKEAVEAVRHRDEPTAAEAGQLLSASLSALRGAGAVAEGDVVQGDPVKALAAALKADPGAGEVIVVTQPHAVEDTFHIDWASKARERLGGPVLHVYAGSSWLG